MSAETEPPPAPIPLTDPSGTVRGFECGKCRAPYYLVIATYTLEWLHRRAQECCGQKTCEACGAPTSSAYTNCQACRAKKKREALLAAFAKAKKVPLAEYDGEMVTDGEEDSFASTTDVDEDSDAIELDDGTRFLWGTAPVKASIDLENECRESWLEEHHESAHEGVDWDKLAEAQVLVDAALAGVVTYFEDRSVAVVLRGPTVAAKRGES